MLLQHTFVLGVKWVSVVGLYVMNPTISGVSSLDYVKQLSNLTGPPFIFLLFAGYLLGLSLGAIPSVSAIDSVGLSLAVGAPWSALVIYGA